MLGNTYVSENAFSTMKRVKSKNRNRMSDEILDDSLRLAPLALVTLVWAQFGGGHGGLVPHFFRRRK